MIFKKKISLKKSHCTNSYKFAYSENTSHEIGLGKYCYIKLLAAINSSACKRPKLIMVYGFFVFIGKMAKILNKKIIFAVNIKKNC